MKVRMKVEFESNLVNAVVKKVRKTCDDCKVNHTFLTDEMVFKKAVEKIINASLHNFIQVPVPSDAREQFELAIEKKERGQ